MSGRIRLTQKITRDMVLFVFGLAGIVYETIIDKTERPTLLVLFGACIGLPAFLHRDEAAAEKVKQVVKDQENGDASEDEASP